MWDDYENDDKYTMPISDRYKIDTDAILKILANHTHTAGTQRRDDSKRIEVSTDELGPDMIQQLSKFGDVSA